MRIPLAMSFSSPYVIAINPVCLATSFSSPYVIAINPVCENICYGRIY